jgi:hydrogenase-4 component B
LDIEKTDMAMTEVFPSEKHYETDPYDKIERIIIDKPLKLLSRFSDIFLFLQNGHLQRYILYGIIFITGVLGVPLVIEKIKTIINFLNNL